MNILLLDRMKYFARILFAQIIDLCFIFLLNYALYNYVYSVGNSFFNDQLLIHLPLSLLYYIFLYLFGLRKTLGEVVSGIYIDFGSYNIKNYLLLLFYYLFFHMTVIGFIVFTWSYILVYVGMYFPWYDHNNYYRVANTFDNHISINIIIKR